MLLLFMPVPCNKLDLWAVNYEWNETNILREILATSYDSVVGLFVEIDVTYPSSLQDSHNDLPLAHQKY